MGNELRRNHNSQCWWTKVSATRIIFVFAFSVENFVILKVRKAVKSGRKWLRETVACCYTANVNLNLTYVYTVIVKLFFFS